MPSAAWIACEAAHGFFECRDSAGGRHLERSGRTQAAEPFEIGALHHAFLVHVGAEEAAAVGLERLQHSSAVIGGFPPALHHDPAVLGVERNQEALAADRIRRERAQQSVDSRRRVEGSRADDHPWRPVDAAPARAPPCARRRRRGMRRERQAVRRGRRSSRADCGIEVDHLNLGESGELSQHLQRASPSSAFRGPGRAGRPCRPSDRCRE